MAIHIFYRISLIICILYIGCSKQEYTACPMPNDDWKILFKAKSQVNPLGHSFCIVCTPNFSSEAVVEWMNSLGVDLGSESPETPCLYAYADREAFPEGFETLAQCQSAICEDGARYNDVVSRMNGNINLDPIIGESSEGDE